MVSVATTEDVVPGHEPAASRPGDSDTTGSDVESGASVVLAPVLCALFGQALPLRFEFFDGGALGPRDGPGVVLIRSSIALRRLLFAPSELGLARSFVAGDIELKGDLFTSLRVLQGGVARDLHSRVRTTIDLARVAHRLGILSRPQRAPQEEARLTGRRHSKRRDEGAIRHHYDLGNDFYRLILGPTMVYSCGRFADASMDLEQAQESKNDLVCRKLGLNERSRARLLDVGCGWGSMALHAARNYGARVVGITLSAEQVELASTHRCRAPRRSGGDPVAGLPGSER